MKTVAGIVAAAALGGTVMAEEAPIPLFPQVVVQTSVGDFTLTLDGNAAPITVANFVRYLRQGHYDGTIFHRVIPGFVAQAGGYTDDLQEKPTVDPIPNESGNGRSNLPGTIAMARTRDPHSARAQFYINLGENTNLDPGQRGWGYTVFGEVTAGMETLEKIAAIPTGPRGHFASDVPQTTVAIERMALVSDAGAAQ